MHTPKTKKRRAGLTLIEALASIAIFTMVGIVIYEFFGGMFVAVQNSKSMLASVELLQEQVEIVRNLSFGDVGISSGVPDGVLQHVTNVTRGGQQYEVTTTVRNIDDPFDGTVGGNPNDLSPADYRLVEIEVACTTCHNKTPIRFTTTQAPKDLETLSTNGALFIRALDGSGLPVANADITVTNDDEFPPILIEDVTDNDGYLRIIDAPPGTNAYNVIATKPGYSTEQTYPIGGPGNPDPIKEDVTVVVQDVTPLSLFIDKVSTINVTSITQTCSAVGNVSFDLAGDKKIGETPDVLKYEQSHLTNGSGQLTLTDMEWDAYTTELNGSTYDLIGLIPLNPLNVAPDSTASLQLVVVPANPRALMVTVKDASSKLPITDAEVTLSRGAYSETKHTGRGYLTQTDWQGGSGQNDYTDTTRFFDSDGNIEIDDPTGELRLIDVGSYAWSGNLTSSSFDTGTDSNFHQISWQPTDQPPEVGPSSVRLQVATNTDNMTWNFTGPDGTSGSYYTPGETTIHSSHDGDRYLRYKIFLTTNDNNHTPNVSDINFTFSSSCQPPGQALFSGLSPVSYGLEVTASGYQDYTDGSVLISDDWAEYEVLLSTD